MTHQVVFLGRLWFLFVIFIEFSKLKEKWDCKTLVGHRRPRCSSVLTFSRAAKRKMGKCGFRANPDRRGVFSNTKIYFQTTEMDFQTTPSWHFTHHRPTWRQEPVQLGLLASKAGKWCRKIIERSGHWYALQRFLQWMSTNKHSTKKETRSMDKLDCLNETMSHHQIGLDLLLRRQCCLSSWQWKEQIFTFDSPATRCVLDTKYSWRALRKENCPNIWYYIGVH